MRKLVAAALLVLAAATSYANQDQVVIKSVQAKELKPLASRLLYSVKVDVENAGETGKVFVDVVGLDGSGFEIAHTSVNGVVSSGETRSLTGTTLMDPKNGQIVKWEAKSFFKTD